MITRETDYAVRALLHLALQESGQVVSTTILASAMEIPYRFLRRILLKLTAEGLVTSTRGQSGGLQLARPATEITLLDVVGAVDPASVTLNICLLDGNACNRAPRCVVHDALVAVQATLQDNLAAVTLATLAERDRAQVDHTTHR